MFGSISNKLKLKSKETEIKNLCANEKEFLPRLLRDTSAALLQVGLDFTSKPSIAIACPMLKPFEPFDVTAKYFLVNNPTMQVGLSVCIFLADDPVKTANKYLQLLKDSKYDLNTIHTDKSAGNNISFYVNELTSKATICINLPDFELEAGVIIFPSDVTKRKEAEGEAEKERREIEAERSGLNLLKSKSFQNAFVNLVLEQDLRIGQKTEVLSLGIKLQFKRKSVEVPFDPYQFHGSKRIDWDTLNEFEDDTKINCSELLNAVGLDAEEIPNITLYIRRDYILSVANCGFEQSTSQSFKFRLNDNRSGIIPIEDSFSKVSAMQYKHSFGFENMDKRAFVKFLNIYAEEQN